MTIARQAENIVIRNCMEDAGFEFYVDATAPSDFPIEEGFALFAGVMTTESAPISGYGPFLDSPYFSTPIATTDDALDPEEAANSETRNFEYYLALPAEDQVEYLRAFNGGHDGRRITLDDGTEMAGEGCVVNARQEVLGDRWIDVVVTFNAVQMLLVQLDISQDSEFSAAAAEWSACMADAGYAFDSLGDAIVAGIALRGDSVQPTVEETDQAVVDVSCQNAADLAGAAQRAFDRLERRTIEDNLDVLLTWQTLETEILERSSGILGVAFETAA